MNLVISGGEFKGRKIKTVKGIEIRPTTSKCKQAVFNISQNIIEGAHFLDLFAGSGAMRMEAFSRKASFALLIESKKEACKCIEKNLEMLHLQDRSQIICCDVFKALEKLSKKNFDIVYIDPPYRYYEDDFFIKKILSKLYDQELLTKESIIFIEIPSSKKNNLIIPKEFVIKSHKKYGFSHLIEFIFSIR